MEAVMGIYLLLLAAEDMLRKKIHLILLAAGIVPAVFSFFTDEPPAISERLLGLALGLVFLGISFACRDRFGKGDAVLLCITGFSLGIYGNCALISMAFFLILAYSLALLARGRLFRGSRIPFLPFVFTGYILLQLVN